MPNVMMLSTLTRPDAGWARVAGYDVVRQAKAVQAGMGVTAQAGSPRHC
ncbi:hypothetical protein [Cryptosporangium sp. NPDC048952]